MSAPAGLMLLVAALCTAGLATGFWMAYTRRHYPALRILIVFAALFILLLGVQLSGRLRASEGALVEHDLQALIDYLVLEVDGRVHEHVQGLERMARRWEREGGTRKGIWAGDANSYSIDYPYIQALEWADDSGRICWVVPIVGNKRVLGYDLSVESRRNAVLAAARETGKVAISEPVELVQGGTGILMVRALRTGRAGGAVGGYLLYVFSTDLLFRDALGKHVPEGVRIDLSHRGHSFLTIGDMAAETEYRQRRVLRFAPGWEISVVPGAAFVSEAVTPLPTVVLLGSGVIALLAALALGLMVLAMQRADRSRAAELQSQDREARLAALVNTALDGIVTMDLSGKIETCNPAAAQMFGYPAGEIVGQNVSMLMPEPFRSHHDEYLRCYNPARESRVVGKVIELSGQRKDGGIFPLELAVSEMLLGDRKVFLGLLRDISVRKETERKLMQARDEAEQASRAKSEFLSSMSHELRTPMNAILGFGQLLEMDRTLDGSQRESVREIVKAGNHLLSLINDVLDLAKVESGGIGISLDRVEVGRLLEECEKLAAPYAAECHVSLKLERAPCAGLAVSADHTRLKQALLNLITNAIKYNRSGGLVTVTCRNDNARVRLLVKDTGHGIAKEKMSRLFQPFDRLGAELSAIEGTGIGLTLTKKLVEMMQGEIGVESEVGVGSTFWLELPLAAGEVTPRSEATDEAGADRDIVGAPGKTVLYIEDNPSSISLMRGIFTQRARWRLIDAASAELGLPLARARRPDAILLDINLPGMDGYALLTELRQTPELRGVPVVALSASAMERDIAKGMAAGFDAYLTKPVDVD
ncbi:MAG: PAS domain S-box protein, partial [Pseudomonadota bacterium]